MSAEQVSFTDVDVVILCFAVYAADWEMHDHEINVVQSELLEIVVHADCTSDPCLLLHSFVLTQISERFSPASFKPCWIPGAKALWLLYAIAQSMWR